MVVLPARSPLARLAGLGAQLSRFGASGASEALSSFLRGLTCA
jgi:hypothetical protein